MLYVHVQEGHADADKTATAIETYTAISVSAMADWRVDVMAA